MPAAARASRRAIGGDFLDAVRYLESEGWTDGLPVIPPTEPLVGETLRYTKRAPDEVLGQMEPLRGTVTVEKVAANAVMAGCLPEYFPVVLASVRAVLQPQFHVGSTACTTGGSAPVIIVNGPVAARLGISGGTACFGGNFKPNATIGRALRLVMRNLGGAKPDGMEKSTQAWPGKTVGCCFAENEERSPWEPFHVERGHARETSTVTVLATRGIYPVTEGTQTQGEGIVETVVRAMRYVGTPIFHQMRNRLPVIVALCPEHAQEIARAGFGRRELRERLHAEVWLSVGELIGRVYYGTRAWPEWIDESNPDTRVPMVLSPDDIWLVVAGGDGRHSAWMPAWGVCQGATEVIEEV